MIGRHEEKKTGYFRAKILISKLRSAECWHQILTSNGRRLTKIEPIMTNLMAYSYPITHFDVIESDSLAFCCSTFGPKYPWNHRFWVVLWWAIFCHIMTRQPAVCNDAIIFLSLLPRDDHVIISSSSRHHRQKAKRSIDIVNGATRITNAHRQRHESERNTTIWCKSWRLEEEKSNESGNNDDQVVSS